MESSSEKSQFTRRLALKFSALGATLLTARKARAKERPSAQVVGRWSQTHDRVFLGGDFWANPMEDWRIVDGAAECQKGGGDRNIQLITHELTADGSFEMSVRVSAVKGDDTDDRGVGYRIGIQSDINEYRSNSFAKSGISAGLLKGELMLGGKKMKMPVDVVDDTVLELRGEPAGNEYWLTVVASDREGKLLGELTNTVDNTRISGNVALVNNFQPDVRGRQSIGRRYRFSDWSVKGDGLKVHPEREFGPILWTMYTLSDSRSDEGFVLKLSALMAPLGEKDNKTVSLMVERDGSYQTIADADVDTDSWTATFRVPKWDATKDVSYRVTYREDLRDGSESGHAWSGTIKASPTDRTLRLGALTCQNDYGFPYEPVVNNIIKLDPDMLYFSGDQLYEGHGGYGLIRRPADRAILNYLRKYYMFGWAFRHALKDRPTVCIPDDHDVFHGNIWGEGGAAMSTEKKGTSSLGGYIEPPKMVNVVHKTNCGHHPESFDPTPVKQGISVYYGDLVYGNVSFAILGDRQFKSAPTRVDTGAGRADHVPDANFDTSVLDKPGLVLLGERQEKFLEQWADDWRGHGLKVLLSQTVFAGVATHHGGKNGFLKADLDSGGWPQTARNNAIRIIRKAKCLHINGDQHLTSLCQYGVDQQRDSNWSFCTPAIAAGYPRWWRPDEMGMPHENRPKHGNDNTGEFLDGLGNKVYVYSIGNPVVGRDKNRYKRAHEKASGFGLVTIDPKAKTYHIESFRFFIDATDGKASNQFPGWPVTIHQQENAGENLLS